jgi:hypothetical protein
MPPANYSRNLRDADFSVSKALPAAAASNATDPLDLGQAKVQSLEGIEFEISVPATPALVDAKKITFTVEDSEDKATFAAVDPAISTIVTGVATNQGGPAKTVRFRLPSQTRRYVRVAAAVETGGGSNIAVSYTLSALF